MNYLYIDLRGLLGDYYKFKLAAPLRHVNSLRVCKRTIGNPSSRNHSETRRILFELVYPLSFVDYNCTTSQG